MSSSSVLFRYLKMDAYRAIGSYKFVIGILGVAGVMLAALLDGIGFELDVLYVFSLVLYGMPFMLTFVFCSHAYSGCFCEDYENKYIHIATIRGNLWAYTASKVITIFAISILTMALGFLLFVGVLRCFLPWISEGSSQYESLVAAGGLRSFLSKGDFIVYYMLAGVQFGMLSGLLSLVAAYFSLFIPNKLLTLSIPVMLFYFIDYISAFVAGRNSISLHMIFSASNNLFGNETLAFLIPAGLAIGGMLVFYVLIYLKLRRKMSNE